MDTEIIKEYSNGEITVVWKPGTCMHSKKCFTGLPEVFDPKAKPWVDMSGAKTDAIIDQVNKCPSGALSWYRNDGRDEEGESDTSTHIEVTSNGPLIVSGPVLIQHTDGSTNKSNKSAALCRCGQSSNKPYCDGTHSKVGFKG